MSDPTPTDEAARMIAVALNRHGIAERIRAVTGDQADVQDKRQQWEVTPTDGEVSIARGLVLDLCEFGWQPPQG